MSWPLSLALALVSAVAGGIGAGLVANVFVTWFRVTSREGAAGYFVVGIGLLGIFGGFVVGLIGARIVAAGASPSILKAIGVGLGATTVVLLLTLGVGWLTADFPPRIEGRDLVLDVEVRFPPAIPLPDPKSSDLYRWGVTVTAMSRGRNQGSGDLRLGEVRRIDGRVVVPATVYLATSDPQRTLGVHCADFGAQFFDLPLPGKPTRADMTWSPWLTEPRGMDRSAIGGDKAVAVRVSVRLDKERK